MITLCGTDRVSAMILIASPTAVKLADRTGIAMAAIMINISSMLILRIELLHGTLRMYLFRRYISGL
jgi:hypothetical protein